MGNLNAMEIIVIRKSDAYFMIRKRAQSLKSYFLLVYSSEAKTELLPTKSK